MRGRAPSCRYITTTRNQNDIDLKQHMVRAKMYRLQLASWTLTTLDQSLALLQQQQKISVRVGGVTCSWPPGQAAGTPASLTLQRSTRHRVPRPLAATACAAPSDLHASSVRCA